MKIEVKMSKDTADRLKDRAAFEKLSKEETQIWLMGYEFAVKQIKKASWFQRLFNLF